MHAVTWCVTDFETAVNWDVCVSNTKLNPLNPKSYQYLISPYMNTAESFIKIVRINDMIANPRSFDRFTNSPFQYERKCKEKDIENMDSDVRV